MKNFAPFIGQLKSLHRKITLYLFTRHIPAYFLLLPLLVAGMFGLSFAFTNTNPASADNPDSLKVKISGSTGCNYTLPRLSGFQYVKPLMSAHKECESEKYQFLKTQIESITNNFKTEGKIKSCSVYFQDFGDEGWISVNPDEKYDPASLLKIPIMITVLRLSEDTPGLLERRVFFDKPFSIAKKQVFTSQKLQPGRYYTIKELLKYMICYSDNDATEMLCSHFDPRELNKTNLALGLSKFTTGEMVFTAREISLLLNVLYNAGYLTIRDSEFACSLLAQSDFKKGIMAGMPQGVNLAHKFGEGGSYNTNGELQLHETAIVYLPSRPCLLTIMTKGYNLDELSRVMAGISQTVYNNLVTAD